MRYAGRLEPGKRYGGGSQKLQPQNHPRYGVSSPLHPYPHRKLPQQMATAGNWIPPSRGDRSVAPNVAFPYSPPRRVLGLSRLIQISKQHIFFPPFNTVAEVQGLISTSKMSTSSHKRHRLSQQKARKAYGAQGVDATSTPATEQVERITEIAKNQDNSNPNPNLSSASENAFPLPCTDSTAGDNINATLGVPPPPYETPMANNPTLGQAASTQENSEDQRGFLDSAAASSLSTIPSQPSLPVHRLQFSYHHTPSSNGSGNNPSPSNPPPTNPVTKSLAFNLLHRRHSFGNVEFGTQSSPAKPLNLQVAPEDQASSNLETASQQQQEAATTTHDEANNPLSTTNNNEAGPHASQYTVATAVAPPTDPSSDRRSGPIVTRRPTSQRDFPNLKVKVQKVTEGSYLVRLWRLWRQPPLPCLNPGNSASQHPRLVIVSPNPSTTSPLTLASNHCSQLMRQAKNFTAGVSRSSNGTTKQRRYTNKQPSKRKYAETLSVSTEAASASSTHTSPPARNESNTLQVVTSFALRTLLLEDMWFLEEGTAVVVFFDESLLPPRYGKEWLETWRDTAQSEFLPTVLFQGRPYKQVTGWVHQNSDTEHVIGHHVYRDLFQAMSEHGQRGINIKCPIFSAIDCNISFPPNNFLQQQLPWFLVYNYPNGIFVQADYHPERNWLAIFKKLNADYNDRLTLFHRVLQESPGDRYIMSELRSVWERFQLQQQADAQKVEYEKKMSDALAQANQKHTVPPPIIEPSKAFKKYCAMVDTTLTERLEHCFGKFNNIFEKFLSEHEMRQLANELEQRLPQQFNAIMGYSGYARKIEEAPEDERAMLRKRYSLDVFFQFVVQARKHNNHLLVPFGIVFALAQYACGHGMLATQIPVWFGLSVSKRTMERRVAECIKSYDTKIQQSIRNVTHLLCVFDNLQDGRLLQFQRGQSAIYTRVTARFVMAMYLERLPTWVYSFLARPELTYIQQAIPSPYHLLAFERSKDCSIGATLRSVFDGTYISDIEQTGNAFDCSGSRVRSYVQLIGLCQQLQCLKRFLSTRRKPDKGTDYTLQPVKFAIDKKRALVCKAMNGLRKKRDTNIYSVARQFPSKVVRLWRHIPPVAELLILPVSVLDETTKIGASGIILDFMVTHGLLVWDAGKSVYKPGADWETKWLFVVGDGLSIERMFQFFDDVMSIIDSKKMSFWNAYRQAMSIKMVLHRVVPITGDLHVRFHMLESIYRLFHGGFLQCLQYRLKWKRLDAVDVSNSYRLSHRLVILVFEELDRLMLDTYVCNHLSEQKMKGFLDKGEVEELAVFISKDYLGFLNRQVRESRYWLRRFLCNYLLMVRKYVMFLEAEQHGDAVAMESMVVEFLPYFYIAGKTTSFNIQLRLMELYYHGLPISVLQQVRLNRTKRQKPGSIPSSFQKESALDQIMERLMPFFKAMNHLGTEASFVKVSQMLTACQRAKHFVEFYTRTRSDGKYELAERSLEDRSPTDKDVDEYKLADPGQRNKSTTYPKRRVNRALVTKVLVLAECHVIPADGGGSIAIDVDHFWQALDKTSLEVQKKVRRCGSGKVENDATDEFVLVQAKGMMERLTKANDSTANQEEEVDDTMDDDEESVIDLEDAMKEQDAEATVHNLSVFSDDEETTVLDIEYGNPEFYGDYEYAGH